MLSELGRFEQAMSHAVLARRLAPDLTAGWLAVARVDLARRRWSDAAQSCLAALRLDPDDAEAKVLLGVAQVAGNGRAGRVQAMETLAATLRDNPDSEQVRRMLIAVAWGEGPSLLWTVLLTMIAIATGGVGLVALLGVWTYSVWQRWSTVPVDIRSLVWADRVSRRKILVGLTVLALPWLAAVVLAVVMLNSALAGP